MEKGNYYTIKQTIYIHKNQLLSWISIFIFDLFIIIGLVWINANQLLLGVFFGYFLTKLYYVFMDYKTTRIKEMYSVRNTIIELNDEMFECLDCIKNFNTYEELQLHKCKKEELLENYHN